MSPVFCMSMSFQTCRRKIYIEFKYISDKFDEYIKESLKGKVEEDEEAIIFPGTDTECGFKILKKPTESDLPFMRKKGQFYFNFRKLVFTKNKNESFKNDDNTPCDIPDIVKDEAWEAAKAKEDKVDVKGFAQNSLCHGGKKHGEP